MSSVLLLSGGADSAVLLAERVRGGERPLCLSFDYGQRHRRELEYAAALARHYDCPHEVHALPPALFVGSALTGTDALLAGVPTVVPGRNLALLSLAVARAAAMGLDVVRFAAHASDREVYRDCRAGFVAALNAASEGAYGVRVLACYLGMSKAGVVALGKTLGVPFGLTWSCYAGGDTPCGACGACVARKEAGA